MLDINTLPVELLELHYVNRHGGTTTLRQHLETMGPLRVLTWQGKPNLPEQYMDNSEFVDRVPLGNGQHGENYRWAVLDQETVLDQPAPLDWWGLTVVGKGAGDSLDTLVSFTTLEQWPAVAAALGADQ